MYDNGEQYMTDYLSKLFTECLVVDTETTALDFKEAEIIQYASQDVLGVLGAIADESYDVPCEFYKPSTPITAKISSITTITNRMVADSGKFEDALADVQAEFDRFPYMIAHNAVYDNGVFEKYGLKTPTNICTMRLARKLLVDDPSIEEHKLSYLRYALDLPIPDNVAAHLADADVMVTALLFVKLVEMAIERGIITDDRDYAEQIVEYLEAPVIVTIMPFGKHKGQKLVEVPLSYWQWAMANFDSLNEDDAAYDKDFSASVANAIEEILENAAN
jgi:DNA polymerase III alpha subunit (gram-positive type)